MNVCQPRTLHGAETVCTLAQAAHDRGHHDAHARGRRVAASAPCSSKDSAQSPNKTVSVKHL